MNAFVGRAFKSFLIDSSEIMDKIQKYRIGSIVLLKRARSTHIGMIISCYSIFEDSVQILFPKNIWLSRRLDYWDKRNFDKAIEADYLQIISF